MLPTQLKVGPHIYRVLVEDEVLHEGVAAWGMYHGPTQTIYLDRTLMQFPTLALETVLHEALHAIGRGEAWPEAQVTMISTGIAGVLIENPALWALVRKAAKANEQIHSNSA